MKTVRAVRVKWVDSTTDGGWNPAAGVASTANPTKIASVGYLLEAEAEAKAKELAAELEETIYQAWGTHSRPVAP